MHDLIPANLPRQALGNAISLTTRRIRSAGKNCQYCQLLHFWCPSNVAGNETFAPSETLKYPRLPSLERPLTSLLITDTSSDGHVPFASTASVPSVVGETSPSLTMSAVSSTFAHTTACTRKRAPFRSRRWFARFQPGLAFNRWGQELSPTQPSLRSLTAIMITCSNSPVRGAGCPIITSVIYCTPSRCPGSPACEPSVRNWP